MEGVLHLYTWSCDMSHLNTSITGMWDLHMWDLHMLFKQMFALHTCANDMSHLNTSRLAHFVQGNVAI